jgi:hypothetical protein
LDLKEGGIDFLGKPLELFKNKTLLKKPYRTPYLL